jgi:competence protein ComEA
MFVVTKMLPRLAEGWHRRLLYGVAAVLALALGTGAWMTLATRGPSPGPAAAPPAALDPAEPAVALVFVSGAVVHPGLYRLSAGARIADAVAAAGGLSPDADPGRLPDLAARVHDGRQVNVPFRRTTGRATSDKLDVNTATLEELKGVPGMPLGLPEAIVSYRELYGGFRSLSDMRVMLGLNAAVITPLRPYLRVVPVAP